MKPFRFIHTADLHLGAPFRGLGERLSTEWMRRLREAAYQSFSFVVDLAIGQAVDFVVISGDLFDAAHVPMAVQFELRRGFARLLEKGIAVYACHGNHDPLGDAGLVRWPENVHVFPAAPALVQDDYVAPSAWFEPGPGTRVQLSGFSYGQRELYGDFAHAFVRETSADYAIGLYHGSVGDPGSHQAYAATTLKSLTDRGFDYFALGHIHQPLILQTGRPTVAYSGNPQGRHIRETGARGVMVIDVDAQGKTDVRFQPLANVLWTRCEISVVSATDMADVVELIKGQLRELLREQSTHEFIVRLELSGPTAIHRHLVGQVDELRETVQDTLEVLRWPVCVERIEIHTTPEIDLETLRQSDQFVGMLLREVINCKTNLQLARAWLEDWLAELFHRGHEMSVGDMSDSQVAALLDEVEQLIVAELQPTEVNS